MRLFLVLDILDRDLIGSIFKTRELAIGSGELHERVKINGILGNRDTFEFGRNMTICLHRTEQRRLSLEVKEVGI